MVIKSFLFCFTIAEGSWICAIVSMFLGGFRVYLQYFNLKFRERMTEETRKHIHIRFHTIQVISILQLSAAAVSIAVSLAMLIGLFKQRRYLLIPWMLWVCIEELFSIVMIIFYANAGVKLKWSVGLSEAVILIVAIYFMLCVYSQFKQMGQEELYDRIGLPILMRDESDDNLITSPILINRPI